MDVAVIAQHSAGDLGDDRLDMLEVQPDDARNHALAKASRQAHGVVFDIQTQRLAVIDEHGEMVTDPLTQKDDLVDLEAPQQPLGLDLLIGALTPTAARTAQVDPGPLTTKPCRPPHPKDSSMDCPACGRTLTATPVNGVTVDACQGGCGGVWFDKHEIAAFDEPAEQADPLLTISRDETVVPDGATRRACPRCTDIIMQRHFFSHRFEVEVDECAGCGGLWLDHGELHGIRSQFRTQQERDADRESFLEGGLAPHLAEIAAATRSEAERADSMSRLFRWLCPSAWIPGRQDSGNH